jgi:hypothetical protein
MRDVEGRVDAWWCGVGLRVEGRCSRGAVGMARRVAGIGWRVPRLACEGGKTTCISTLEIEDETLLQNYGRFYHSLSQPRCLAACWT